jgi:hypothetical protein
MRVVNGTNIEGRNEVIKNINDFPSFFHLIFVPIWAYGPYIKVESFL